MIIAMDGPAGTGKSTIASIIAKKLGVTYLNSGSFYRALTLLLLNNGVDLTDESAIVAFCKKQRLDYKNSRLELNGIDVEDSLHNDEVSKNVAQISAIVPIRHLVNERMQELTKSLDIVCEGRDMTTVVFPNADCKLYLDASLDVQAERRFKQGVSNLSLEEIKEAIKKRDEIDKTKAEGALKIAPDAYYIDTSNLTIDEVCEIIYHYILKKGFVMEEMEVEKEESADKANFQTQLEESLNNRAEPKEGQLVEGTVVQVTEESVFLDVGCKSEGRLPIGEFSDSLPTVGDKVQVLLDKKFGRNGPEISKAKADAKRMWKDVQQAYKEKKPVSGTITKIVKGGYDVSLGGDVHAFLPISQSDSQRVEKPESLIGVKSSFYVERLYSENKVNVVVNRRKYLEEQIDAKRDAFFENVKIDDTVKGVVKSFTSFGAFIDLGGFDGLLHINDMSWGHVARPKDFVKRGQEIELKVIRMDSAAKRINLSLKHFTEDPWMHFEEKFHVNDIVKGKVTKLTEFGAFVELEEGIEGLVHISEFSWTKKVNKPADMVNVGDEVECMILGYDIQGGRVSLGLKQVSANPWDSIGEKYPVGTKVSGKVVKVINTGAFVALEDGIEAFLHVDDLFWTKKVKHAGSELSANQEIEGVVIECDVEKRNIKIGVKQLTESPWKQFAADHKSGTTLEGEITSITDFGVFVRVDNGIEGLVNKSNLSEDPKTPFEEAVKKYKVGDKINVYVVDVNVGKEKASFSVREFTRKQQRDDIAQYMSTSSNEDAGAYTLGDFLKNQKN